MKKTIVISLLLLTSAAAESSSIISDYGLPAVKFVEDQRLSAETTEMSSAQKNELIILKNRAEHFLMLRFNGVDAVDDTNVDDVNLWTERVGPLLNKTAAQYSGLWVDRYKESNGEKQPENLWTYYAKSNDDTGFLVICDTVKLKSVVKEGSFTGLEYHAKELAIIGKKTSFLENDPIFETTIFFDQFKKIDHVIQKGASVPSLYTAMNYTGRKSIFSTFKNKCDNK